MNTDFFGTIDRTSYFSNLNAGVKLIVSFTLIIAALIVRDSSDSSSSDSDPSTSSPASGPSSSPSSPPAGPSPCSAPKAAT